jgi:hypothetical protein
MPLIASTRRSGSTKSRDFHIRGLWTRLDSPKGSGGQSGKGVVQGRRLSGMVLFAFSMTCDHLRPLKSEEIDAAARASSHHRGPSHLP